MTPLRYALNEYKQTSIAAGTAFADPHTLITMLFNGLQERIAVAKGAMERSDIPVKGQSIGKAMDIITYLQACLDKERGGEIAANLDELYEYLIGCLFRANSENNPALLDEVSGLLREIEHAWSAIRLAANKAPSAQLSMAGL